MKILIIEDEADLIELIGTALREDGHEVSSCVSGAEVEEALGASDPELVIADVFLPDFNIVKFAENHLTTRRIIVMTGRLDQPTKDQLESLGITNFLNKPFAIPDLVELIANL